MSADPPGPGGPPDEPVSAPEPSGIDLARSALARAKAAAREKGLQPGRPAVRRLRTVERRSGSGADDRDPVLFGDAIKRLVADRGWEATTASARVIGEWDRLVGPEIADHCRPTSLVDGALVLVAESSAWATQLRLLTRTLQKRLTEQVGEGVVTSVEVRGPAQPDWRKGPRRVTGPGARGPRDTYG
ncbi:MAG: DciA family protein [Mycobacteriales bacterium]|nr:DciA family protein [Mycobacteriales bacterium]